MTGTLCANQIEASTSTSRATPRAFEFLEKILFISPSPDRKAVQMPHHSSISGDQMPTPLGKLPDDCFNFSVASIMYASEAVYVNMV